MENKEEKHKDNRFAYSSDEGLKVLSEKDIIDSIKPEPKKEVKKSILGELGDKVISFIDSILRNSREDVLMNEKEESVITPDLIIKAVRSGELSLKEGQEILNDMQRELVYEKAIETLIKAHSEGKISDDILEKAITKVKDYTKLNKVKKLVYKNGKVFLQNFYVKTGEEADKDKPKKEQEKEADWFSKNIGEIAVGDVAKFKDKDGSFEGYVNGFSYEESTGVYYINIVEKETGESKWKKVLPKSGLEKVTVEVKKEEPRGNVDNNGYEFVKALGGSTGAKLVEKDGVLYVKKTGNSPEHLANEVRSIKYFKEMGVPVPEIFEYKKGDAVYLEYIDGVSLKSFTEMFDKDDSLKKFVSKYFVANCLMMNWDCIGMDEDNVILFDSKPVFVDVGGSMGYRAQGSSKHQWNEWDESKPIEEFTTMRNKASNYSAGEYFEGVTEEDIKEQLKLLHELQPDCLFGPETEGNKILRKRFQKAYKQYVLQNEPSKSLEVKKYKENDHIYQKNRERIYNLYLEDRKYAYKINRPDIVQMYDDLERLLPITSEEKKWISEQDFKGEFHKSGSEKFMIDNNLEPHHLYSVERHISSTNYDFKRLVGGNFNIDLNTSGYKGLDEESEIYKLLNSDFNELEYSDKKRVIKLKSMVDMFAVMKENNSKDYKKNISIYRGFDLIDKEIKQTYSEIGNVIITPNVNSCGSNLGKTFSGNTHMIISSTDAVNISTINKLEDESITKPFHMIQIIAFSNKAKEFKHNYKYNVYASKVGVFPSKFD